MELLQDFNGYNTSKPSHVNLLTTTTYLPTAYHTTHSHHHSKRHHHHRHLTDIDWNYEIEREKDNRDRLLFNEKVVEVKARRSRPRTIHHKMFIKISIY